MLTLVMGRRIQGKSTLAYYISLRTPTRVIFSPRKNFKTTDDILPNADGLYELLDTRSEIIVEPRDDVKGVFDLTAREIADWVEDNPNENISFLDDEAFFIDTPNREYPDFDRLIRFGDPEKVHVQMTMHRPSDVSTGIRSIANHWCMFKTTLEHDLDIIEKRCGPEVADAVYDLKAREYVVWSDDDATWAVKKEPHAWYADIKLPSRVSA